MFRTMNKNELMRVNGGGYAVPCYKTIDHKLIRCGSCMVPNGSPIVCYIDGIPYTKYPRQNPYM